MLQVFCFCFKLIFQKIIYASCFFCFMTIFQNIYDPSFFLFSYSCFIFTLCRILRKYLCFKFKFVKTKKKYRPTANMVTKGDNSVINTSYEIYQLMAIIFGHSTNMITYNIPIHYITYWDHWNGTVITCSKLWLYIVTWLPEYCSTVSYEGKTVQGKMVK